VPAGLAADDLHSLATTIASRNDGAAVPPAHQRRRRRRGGRPPTGTRRRPPLGFCHEVGPPSGTSWIGRDRHRLRAVNETNGNRADRGSRNSALGEAKEITTGRSVIVVVLLVLLGSPQDLSASRSARAEGSIV